MSVEENPALNVDAAKSSLLVFGISARIGSGASFVAQGIDEELKAFGYKTTIIKITRDFLEDENISRSVSDEAEIKGGIEQSIQSEQARRVIKLQNIGNELRKKYGNEILSVLGVNKIIASCEVSDRHAFIIDSLKHPAEVKLLESIFRGAYYTIGIMADDNVRKRRLEAQKSISGRDFEHVSDHDADEDDESGQHAIDTLMRSDYFFANNSETPDKIASECKRLLNLIFQSSIITPTQDEYGMNLARMASDKSACLSRQVGSAVVSSGGEVLATGCNDVPKYGGGLYNSESPNDKRCFVGSMRCHNDLEKRAIQALIIKEIKETSKDFNQEQIEAIQSVLQKSRIRLLIEFTRAVHAEMDAIIAIARNATEGLVGSTMYVTTYPCHNCAKHIIDAGIKRVVYIEPYSKSLALKLHPDAIKKSFR